MGVFKRAWISVLQKKVNSIVLLVIVFILANVLLTTLSVNSSIKSTKDSVLSKLTPAVSIDFDEKVWSEEVDKIPTLNAEMATKLYNNTKDIVAAFDYTQSTGLTAPEGFKEATLLSEEQLEKITGGSFPMTPGERMGVSIIGTQLSVKPEEAKEGKLVNGKGFSKSDIEQGNNKILVTKYFAEANNIEVGSKLMLTSQIFNYEDESFLMGENTKPVKELEYEFDVVGMVEINAIEDFLKKAKNADADKIMDEYFQVNYQANQIYMPNEVVSKINKEMDVATREANPGSYEGEEPSFDYTTYVQPQYVLKDMGDLDAFTKEAIKIFPEGKYKVTSASDTYDAAAKPLNSMGGLLDTIFIITVVSSVVILALVLCIFMYLRQKEMGIYLALGERKKKIIGQLLAETLIIALIGATLAIFTSIIFSNMLADNAIASLLAPQDDMLGGMIVGGGSTTTITPEMISQQYSGGFSIMTIIIFYGTMFATIVAAQLATVMYLLRLSPKKILM